MQGDNNWLHDFENSKQKKSLERTETSSTVSSFLPPGVTLETVKNSKTQIYQLDAMLNSKHDGCRDLEDDILEDEEVKVQESAPPGLISRGDEEKTVDMTEEERRRNNRMKERLSRSSTRGSLMEIPGLAPDVKDEEKEMIQRTKRTKPLRPSVTKKKAKEMFTFMRNQTRRIFQPLRKSGVFRDRNEEQLEMDIVNEMTNSELWTTVAAYVGSNAVTFFVIWLCAEYILWA